MNTKDGDVTVHGSFGTTEHCEESWAAYISDLDESFKSINESDRPLIKNFNKDKFNSLFEQRKDLYFQSSDLIVWNENLEKSVKLIFNEMYE